MLNILCIIILIIREATKYQTIRLYISAEAWSQTNLKWCTNGGPSYQTVYKWTSYIHLESKENSQYKSPLSYYQHRRGKERQGPHMRIAHRHATSRAGILAATWPLLYFRPGSGIRVEFYHPHRSAVWASARSRFIWFLSYFRSHCCCCSYTRDWREKFAGLEGIKEGKIARESVVNSNR